MSTSHATRPFAFTAAVLLIAASLATFAAPAQASFHGSLGSFVSSVGDKDFVTVLDDAPGTEAFCFGFIEDSTNPWDASKYAWLFHIAADGTCDGTTSPTAQRSWLITAFGGTVQQKWLTTADTQYTGRTFTGIQELDNPATDTWICYLEADGIDGYSIGDIIYIKQGFSTAATQALAANDLRVSAVSSAALSAVSASVGIVKSTDTDFTRGGESSTVPPTADPSRLPINRTMVCGGFAVKMLNLGSLGIVNSADVFYLVHNDLLTDTTVYPGMLRITSTTGVTGHGQKVLVANTDAKRTLQILAANALNMVVVDDLGSGDIFDKKIAIQQTNHPAGPDAGNNIRMHDIFIKRGTGHAATSAGTLATSAPSTNQIGVGSNINDGSTALAAKIYYIDTAPVGVFDGTDPVYIKHRDNTGTGVEAGDVRVAVPSQTAGSSVRTSDSDFLEHQSATAVFGFQLKLFSERDDTRMPLKAVTNGKFISSTDINTWSPTTDPVFITTASTLTTGGAHRQVWDPAANAGAGGPVNTAFDCDATNPTNPAWCGETLKTGGSLKTTGEKTAWLNDGENDGDRLFWSEDNFLTIGDYRMGHGAVTSNHVATTGRVVAGDADATPGARFQSSGVTLFASQHTGFRHPTAGDVQLFPSFGTRWTSSTTDAVPMTSAPAFQLVRADTNEASTILDDGFYLDFSPSAFTPGRVLRVTPVDSKAAGTFVQSADTIEIQAAKTRTGDAEDADHFGFVETGSTGLDPSDFVYLNVPASLGGSAGQTLTQWDARVTQVSHGGTNFASGTQVKPGDADLQSFPSAALQAAGDGSGSGAGSVIWWDANLNGVVDQNDALWLRLRAGPPANVPTFLDVRLNGPAGSSGGPSGGGGAPTSPVPSLSGGAVTPEFVQVNGAQTFQVTYTHGGNDAPTTRNVIIDGTTYAMTGSGTGYSGGVLYSLARTMNTAGEFDFHFEFREGDTTVRHPTTGSLTAYVGPSENVAPSPSQGTAPPSSGSPGDSFTFGFVYKDANNNPPVDPQVHLEWNPTETLDLECDGTTYYKGVTCSVTTTLTDEGEYRYHFTASDGTNEIRFPETGTLAGPTVAAGAAPPPPGDGDGDGDDGDADGDSNGTPAPAVLLVLLAVAAHLAWARRRR